MQKNEHQPPEIANREGGVSMISTFSDNVARREKAPAQGRYRRSSVMRKNFPVGPYSRPLPRALRWSQVGGV